MLATAFHIDHITSKQHGGQPDFETPRISQRVHNAWRYYEKCYAVRMTVIVQVARNTEERFSAELSPSRKSGRQEIHRVAARKLERLHAATVLDILRVLRLAIDLRR